MQEQFVKESKELSKTIENESSWFKIFNLFEKLIKIENKREIYLEILPIISELLTRSIQSDRSRLNGISLDFLKVSYPICYKEFNYNPFLPILVKLTGKANKVFVTRALEAITVICKYIDLKYFQKISVDNIENVNKNVRFAIFSMIKLRFNESVEAFAPLIEKGLKDPSQEVRSICKEISIQKTAPVIVKNEIIKNPMLSLTPRKNFKVDNKHAEIKKLEKEVTKITREPVFTKPLSNNFFEKLNQLKKERFTEEKRQTDELTPRKLDKYLEKFRNSTPVEFIPKSFNEKNNINSLETQSILPIQHISKVSIATEKLYDNKLEETFNQQRISNNLSDINNMTTNNNPINIDTNNMSTNTIETEHISICKHELALANTPQDCFNDILENTFKNSKIQTEILNDAVKAFNNENQEESIKLLESNSFDLKNHNESIQINCEEIIPSNHNLGSFYENELFKQENHSSSLIKESSFIHKVADQEVAEQIVNSDNIFDVEIIDEYNNSLVFNEHPDLANKISIINENSSVIDLSKSFASINIEASNTEHISPSKSTMEIPENNNQNKESNADVDTIINNYYDDNFKLEHDVNNLQSNLNIIESGLKEIENDCNHVSECPNEHFDLIDGAKIIPQDTNAHNNQLSIENFTYGEPEIPQISNIQDFPYQTQIQFTESMNQVFEQLLDIDIENPDVKIGKSLNEKNSTFSNNCNANDTVILDKNQPILNPALEFSFLNQEETNISKISFINTIPEACNTDITFLQDSIILPLAENNNSKKLSSIPLFNEEIFDSENEDVSKKSFILQDRPSFNIEPEYK